jgi:hypothetical protein
MLSTTTMQRNSLDSDRQRAAPRHKIFQPTQLHFASGEVRAHLINVSQSGALVHAAPTPRRGDMIRIEICGTLVPAQVRWTDGPRFGLSFIQPLDATTLKQLLGDS